jgi:lipid-binding SYLF domain-containing protein
VVFPSIAKGAIGIGGAHGKGQVFEKGKLIGEASVSQVTIGFQLGGQVYSEVIFFENKDTLESFKKSELAFSAQVSAVAAAEGASANAKYQLGVAVFTLAKGGLMYEASIGGQKFKFKPNK